VIRINLAPVRERRGRFAWQLPAARLGPAFAALYVVAVLGLSAAWWMLSSEEATLATEVESQESEAAALRAALGQAASTRERMAEIQKRITTIEELTRSHARAVVLLDRFADVIPADLWITGMEEKGQVLKLTGSAFSTTAVADFMTNLRRSGSFREVDIVVARQDHTKPPRLVTFEVTCRFES
jgi:Tfp pilus assembly protein PilN